MSTIKLNELATSETSLSDFFAKANDDGLMTKNTIQELSNIINTSGDVSFRGELLISDTPVNDGWFFAGESGTYTNAGGLVVDISSNLVLIIISETQTNFSKIDIPLSVSFDSKPTEDSSNAVTSGGLFLLNESLDNTVKLITGTNSSMTGSNDWVEGIGSPSFDVNTTVPNKMFIDFTTGNEEIKLSNLLEVNKRYEVRLKARLNSGTSMPIRVGAFVTSLSNYNSFDITPTSVEQEFVGYINTSEVDFSIGCLSANNIGSNIEITDVKVMYLSEELEIVKNTIPDSVVNYGSVNSGIIDNTATIQSMINNSQNNYLDLYFPKGIYLIGELVIDGFDEVYIHGDSATLKALTGNTTIFNISNSNRVVIKDLFCDVNSINLTDGFFKIEDIKDCCKLDNVDFKNFGHNTSYACKFERVSKDTSIAGQENGIGVSFNHCNFYNNQLIPLSSFDYSTSTWLGRCIYFGNDCEYWRVVNCYFRCIHVGIETPDGANGTISACNFSYTNSYDWSTSTSRGVVNILDTVDNNGKLIITGCHFNHNYGVSIKSVYDNAQRPMQVIGNQFIANAYTAIDISNQSKNMIYSNFFDRVNVHLGLINDPFTSNDSKYILINNSSKNSIKNNQFNSGVESSFIVSTGSSDYNLISDNLYVSSTTLFDSVGSNNIERNNGNIL